MRTTCTGRIAVVGHNRKKPGFVSARITDEEIQMVENLTKRKRESVSSFVRRAIAELAQKETKELTAA
jgi:Arc/MetJ-type ribon-helix-helix transcriptional regulator